jgi:hypothetical protein
MRYTSDELEKMGRECKDESLAGLMIALASCRTIEERVGTDLPERALMLSAVENGNKIVSAIKAAEAMSRGSSDYEDWLQNG